MKNFRDVLRNLTIKKICVFAAIIAIIVVAVIFTMMHKAYPHVESILSQLSYGMSFEEVTQITGDLGMNSGSLFFIYHKKFPDGNDVLFLFHGVLSVENKILWRVSILSNDDLFFGQWLDYDLDRQLLLEKFMPESLDGIEYGMKIEEVEEVFCRNAPEDVTFFGASKFRSIIWEGEVITTYEKTDVTTWKKIIKLSTGVWTIMIFEKAAGKAILSCVYMYADDEEWYVYDLNTQELTKEKKDVLIKVPMEAKDGDWYQYNLLTHEVIEKIPNI